MKNKVVIILLACFGAVLAAGCSKVPVQESLQYCAAQAEKTLTVIPSPDKMPNCVLSGSDEWLFASPGSWTSGFWPGELWYIYEGVGGDDWKERAVAATEQMLPVAYRKAGSHDVGFMMTTSVGNAYRMTGEQKYFDALVSAADSLATLYNPNVGTILSWPNMVKKMDWPHNTIVDNMLNLDLLFWVAEHAGRPDLYDIAYSHALVTMKHIFREDHSTYHVMVFDDKTGEFIAGHTHQGWKDDSTWARGQAWAVYGFTMAYRYTRDEQFLQAAMDAADYFLGRLPEDMIPFWDFDAGEQLEAQPRDCSAAAIVASALLELQLYALKDKSREYLQDAEKMISIMSAAPYRAADQCSAFILHCTGHMPRQSEVDASISYGDYYYIESLIRLKKIQKGENLN